MLWLFIGLFSMAIVLTGFRRGERWAWYTMWLLPFLFAFHQLILRSAYKHPEAGTPTSLASGLGLFIVTALTLALSYRKFFPKYG
jgi:hypothetical protein